MSKRKTRSTTTNSASAVTTKATTGRALPNNVEFPELSTKKGLECRVLLEDQIMLIDVRVAGGEGGVTQGHLS